MSFLTFKTSLALTPSRSTHERHYDALRMKTDMWLNPYSEPEVDLDIQLPLSDTYFKQNSIFPDLLTSFIKPFKMSDFSKHLCHVMTSWYYTWKHSQEYIACASYYAQAI